MIARLKPETTSFDFIVIGAGSAGCIVASRLSESGRHTVLLIEAGGSDRSFWLTIPVGYARSYYDPAVNWMYSTEPEPALADRRLYVPRGKVIGGSGAINAMVFVRGAARDFPARVPSSARSRPRIFASSSVVLGAGSASARP